MQTVAIIGIGLIGGSLAAALRATHPDWRIIGINRSPEPLQYAMEHGIISESADSVAAAGDADLIFIATPVGMIVEFIAKVAGVCKPSAIITDVGSTKAVIVEEAERALAGKARFIGGHPMAGSEKTGVEAARSDLFNKAYYLLTPTDNTDPEAFQALHQVISGLGAYVLALSPAEHDKTMAAISHVPHFTSACLVEVAEKYVKKSRDLMQIAAGGFRDMTRVAAGDPKMWCDIAMANRGAISDGLRELSVELARLGEMIAQGKSENIIALLRDAQKSRLSLPHVKQEDISDLYQLSIDVPDRPGVLSEVTVTIGTIGINIENIEIVHSTEKLTGTLILLILGEEPARKASQALKEHGFEISLSLAYG